MRDQAPRDRSSSVRISPPRPLNTWEKEIVNFLLSKEFPGVEALRAQTAALKVSEECKDGCGSVYFSVDPQNAPKADLEQRIPVEATGSDIDGLQIDVLLHVINGYIDQIEIICWGKEKIAAVPIPQRLQLIINEGVLGK